MCPGLWVPQRESPHHFLSIVKCRATLSVFLNPDDSSQSWAQGARTAGREDGQAAGHSPRGEDSCEDLRAQRATRGQREALGWERACHGGGSAGWPQPQEGTGQTDVARWTCEELFALTENCGWVLSRGISVYCAGAPKGDGGLQVRENLASPVRTLRFRDQCSIKCKLQTPRSSSPPQGDLANGHT